MTANLRSSPQRVSPRVYAVTLIMLVTLAFLLALDLYFRGLAWQFFWSQTGEESPVGQIRGMIELGGNLIRSQPNTAAYVPIDHTDEMPFGMNVFLQKEVEEPKIRAMLHMIRDAGFVWLRQEFPWEDIEVDGRGQFTDSRVDYDGDGTPDTIDAWAKYDRLVALTEEYGFRLIVRLSNPPYWAQTDKSETLAANYAPPDDIQDFVNFAAAVAARYKGRILYYQIWNEPNIYPEWGENFADPAAYTDMLCRTYDALKAIDPEIVILSAAIAPTISLDGKAGYQDLVYLQNMYANGAGRCFDILTAQGYGLFSGPTDRRLRLTSVTSTRHIYYRDLMVANGDAHKPIWLSEAAWNAILDAPLPREQIDAFERFGLATQAEAARFMPLAYQRAAEEFPWIGVIGYWFFTRPDPFEANQSFYYFRMVEPDYSPEKPMFTPLPVYTTMKDYIRQARANPVLYVGVHQAESWQITRPETAQIIPAEGAQFNKALSLSGIEFTAYGTEIQIRLKGIASGLGVVRDNRSGRTLEVNAADEWQTITIFSSLTAEQHTFTIAPVSIMETPFLADSITVRNDTWCNLAPLIAGCGGVVLVAAGMVGLALRKRFA